MRVQPRTDHGHAVHQAQGRRRQGAQDTDQRLRHHRAVVLHQRRAAGPPGRRRHQRAERAAARQRNDRDGPQLWLLQAGPARAGGKVPQRDLCRLWPLVAAGFGVCLPQGQAKDAGQLRGPGRRAGL